jgi:hypothetical protein
MTGQASPSPTLQHGSNREGFIMVQETQTVIVTGASQGLRLMVYLRRAKYVTGEVLHMDGGAHAGLW